MRENKWRETPHPTSIHGVLSQKLFRFCGAKAYENAAVGRDSVQWCTHTVGEATIIYYSAFIAPTTPLQFHTLRLIKMSWRLLCAVQGGQEAGRCGLKNCRNRMALTSGVERFLIFGLSIKNFVSRCLFIWISVVLFAKTSYMQMKWNVYKCIRSSVCIA